MAIGIVQLSDIHIHSGDDPIFERAQEIKRAVQGVACEATDLLLVITGDVAFSGKAEEYTLATDFTAAVEQSLQGLTGTRFLGTVVIPGNHDCDFARQGSVRPLLLNSQANLASGSASPQPDFVRQMLEVQEPFFDFEALKSARSLPPKSRLSWTREFQTVDGKITVRCLNTAWLSQKDEVRKLWFPESLVSAAGSNSELVLTLFHHPYNWFEQESGKAFKKIVETTSDVVLTGHEHDGDAYAKVSSSGSTTNYVEGAALQAGGVETGFNYVEIDLAARTYRVHPFRWAKDMYSAATVHPVAFARNQALLEHRFINNTEFHAKLQDLGTPFSHPTGVELRLRDLFVYPDLGVTHLDSTPEKTGKPVTSPNVLSYIVEKKRVLLAGAAMSGRTSLAKILYEDLQRDKGIVPVLLSASDLKGATPAQVIAAVARAFARQYSPSLSERFGQLDLESKAVIVDDWHKINFSLKGKGLIAETLGKEFGRLVFIGDDASILRQVGEIEAFEGFADFEHCEIKPFGCRLRAELITKWHSIGAELEIGELELAHRVSASENLLDTLIGKGVLPPFPVFVFSVLQAKDHVSGQNVAYGSYGHIYEALLTERMARVNNRNLGRKYTYLSILAHRMFRSGKSALSADELKQMSGEYWDNYTISIDERGLVDELVKSQILNRTDGEVSFQHKFAYYFFVAKYFQDGMADTTDAASLSSRLKQMADEAYDDEKARILIFYLYLTKDRPLIEHIAENAHKLFANRRACDLDRDVSFVNALYCARPTLVAPSEDTRKNREEFRRQRDEVAEGREETSLERTAESLQIDLAMQSLQIMGQILKNFPDNLRGDLKLRLAKESYQLGLRSLNDFLKAIEGNCEQIRDAFMKHLREHGKFARRDVAEASRAADKLIVGLSELAIFAVLKKVSFSVGLEDLRDVYRVMRSEAGEDDIPIRLIDLSIALDHFALLPVDDVRDLEYRLRNNTVVHTVLRLLIGQHLALFPVKYKTRQNMVQLFNFQPQPSALVERAVRHTAG
jgi:predicted MPP superfamily phosphohydrolase